MPDVSIDLNEIIQPLMNYKNHFEEYTKERKFFIFKIKPEEYAIRKCALLENIINLFKNNVDEKGLIRDPSNLFMKLDNLFIEYTNELYKKDDKSTDDMTDELAKLERKLLTLLVNAADVKDLKLITSYLLSDDRVNKTSMTVFDFDVLDGISTSAEMAPDYLLNILVTSRNKDMMLLCAGIFLDACSDNKNALDRFKKYIENIVKEYNQPHPHVEENQEYLFNGLHYFVINKIIREYNSIAGKDKINEIELTEHPAVKPGSFEL